jgi:SAM-dependent methyltransferase
MPTIEDIRDFWERNPVAAAGLGEHGSVAEFLEAFDELRESEDVEPFPVTERIHRFSAARGKRVLDVGCGNGYVLSHYARHGADVAGADVTARAIELTRERFRLLGLEADLRQVDGFELPFEDASFDVVCSMGVLHHVPDPTPLVREIERVLKPGGELLVMLYHRGSLRYRVLMPFRRRFGPEGFRGRSRQEVLNMNDGADNPWAAVYSPEEVRTLLGAFEGHRFFVWKLPARELGLYLRIVSGVTARLPKPIVDALARRIGWNLYCVAYKPGPTDGRLARL